MNFRPIKAALKSPEAGVFSHRINLNKNLPASALIALESIILRIIFSANGKYIVLARPGSLKAYKQVFLKTHHEGVN